MSQVDIVRAWKDEEYRTGLSPEQQAIVPPHPCGALHLNDAALSSVAGGSDGSPLCMPPPDFTITVCPWTIIGCLPPII